MRITGSRYAKTQGRVNDGFCGSGFFVASGHGLGFLYYVTGFQLQATEFSKLFERIPIAKLDAADNIDTVLGLVVTQDFASPDA